MTVDTAEIVARAVLYEGYLLYPYYASSSKNRYRFQFGGLYPNSYVNAHPGADRAVASCEFLVSAAEEAQLRVSFRGLQLLSENPGRDEAEERRIEPEPATLKRLAHKTKEETARFGSGPTESDFRVRVSAERVGLELYRVRVEAANVTEGAPSYREGVLRHSLLSAHFLCSIDEGNFVSQLDPPADIAEEAARNRTEGLYPVLVGEEQRRDRLLAAPIILYDYPRIAPESRGDLFDGLEIDEILSLRIRTLTDSEKEAVRASGPRAAALLDRTEGLTDEELLGLHGARRPTQDSTPVRPGDRVRLRPRPKQGADIFDIALEGKVAVVESVEQTLEDDCLLAVTLDDDPGRDLGRAGMIGHRFFFRPDEVERLHA
jgi:hypothetical protein